MQIDWKTVLRDVLIVLVLAGLGRFVAAALLGEDQDTIGIIGAIATLFMVAGFCASGCLVPVRRFRHMTIVALGVWLAGPIVRFGAELSIALWIVAALPIFAAMGIGGAISLAIVPTPPAEPSAPPAAQP